MSLEHVEEFAGKPVNNYDPDDGIEDPMGTAQRLALEFESPTNFEALFARFLADPASRQVGALVIGPWWPGEEGYSPSGGVVAALVAARDRLEGLKAIFLGDVTSEECEISWIEQSDVTPLLEAYPALEELRVRGGTNLALGECSHRSLKDLTIQAGGLPSAVVRAVLSAGLPALEHLELWLGTDEYGGDSTLDDLAPLLSGAAFPALKRLGLRNCEYADALAAALADSPILRRIEVLDLSLGNLGDEGALALIRSGALSGLKALDIDHHYVSDEVLDGLMATGIEVIADERADPDPYGDGEVHRFISVTE